MGFIQVMALNAFVEVVRPEIFTTSMIPASHKVRGCAILWFTKACLEASRIARNISPMAIPAERSNWKSQRPHANFDS